MNKKGYTVIELLAVITIIGLLFSIAIVAYSGFIDKANNKVYETYIDSLHEAAVIYFTKNASNLPFNGQTKYFKNSCNNETDCIPFSALKIENIKNPKKESDKCLDSTITATRNDISGNISINYKVKLICNDSNYTGEKEFTN